MANTVTPGNPVSRRRAENKRVNVFDLAVTGTYVTGGFTVTASQLGLRKIEEFIIHGCAWDSAGSLGYVPVVQYQTNRTSVKVILLETGSAAAGSAEKGNGEDVGTLGMSVTAVGY